MVEIFQREVTPSTVVNDRTQGAVLTIAVACGICCTFLFLSVRLLIRRPWRSLFGKDDTAATTATLIGLAQAVLILEAVTEGLGTRTADLSNDSVVYVEKLIYISDLVYVLAMYSSKLGISLFFARLSDMQPHRLRSQILSTACVAFCLVSLLVLGLQLPISAPWTAATSQDRLYRWIAVEVMSALVDIAIMAFPIALVVDLQMKTGTKISIVSRFALRSILIPLAILRLISFTRSTTSLFDFIIPALYLQVEMCYSIVSATIPCLGMFLQGASPDFLAGHSYIDPTGTARGIAGGSSSAAAYKMSSLSRSRRRHYAGSINLTSWRQAESMAQASKGSRVPSVASDSSERAIVVQQTINVQFSSAV